MHTYNVVKRLTVDFASLEAELKRDDWRGEQTCEIYYVKNYIFRYNFFKIRLEISLVESLRSRLLVFEVCLGPALINISTGKILKAVNIRKVRF